MKHSRINHVVGRSQTVMVVDDDKDLRSMVVTILNAEGLDVVTAGDGQEALDLMSSGDLPDLILSDMQMPGMAGPELLSKLQINPRTKHVRVVMVSGLEGMDAKSKQMGANACLKKPYTLDSLTSMVKNQLSLRLLHH